jgi:hypothetical protein
MNYKEYLDPDQAVGGYKNISHGFIFQFQFLRWLILFLYSQDEDFEVLTEIDQAGKFDDAIFTWKKKLYLFQAKNRHDESGLTQNDLLKDSDNFGLIVYLSSFLEIMRRNQFNFEATFFCLFTNTGINFQYLTEKDKKGQLIQKPEENLLSYLKKEQIIGIELPNKDDVYKFKTDESSLDFIIKKLGNQVSEAVAMDQLAQLLAEAIVDGKEIDTSSTLFEENNMLLVKHIIDVNNKTLFSEFTGNKKIDAKILLFKKILIKRIEILLQNKVDKEKSQYNNINKKKFEKDKLKFYEDNYKLTFIPDNFSASDILIPDLTEDCEAIFLNILRKTTTNELDLTTLSTSEIKMLNGLILINDKGSIQIRRKFCQSESKFPDLRKTLKSRANISEVKLSTDFKVDFFCTEIKYDRYKKNTFYIDVDEYKNQLKSFLDQFYLGVNQPTDLEFDNLIYEMIKELNKENKKPISPDIFKNDFYLFIDDWIKEKKSRILKTEHIETFSDFVDIKQLSNQNKQKLQKLNIEFEKKKEKWYNAALNFQKTADPVLIVKSESNQLPLISSKIFQVFQYDNLIYLKTEDIKSFSDEILKVLKHMKIDENYIFLFAIGAEVKSDIEKIYNENKNLKNKKIFVTAQFELKVHGNSNTKTVDFRQNNDYTNLTDESQKHFDGFKVLFQDNEISIGDLLYDNTVKKKLPLIQLINNESISIKTQFFQFENAMYFERTFETYGDEQNKTTASETALLEHKKKVIISDNAMGKSAYVNNLAKTLKNRDLSSWVLIFNLSKFTKELLKISQINNIQQYNSDQWITIISKELLCFDPDSFADTVFTQSFYNNKCNIIFDEVDKILGKHENIAKKMIAAFQEKNTSSLTIVLLEKNFQSMDQFSAFKLIQFNDKDKSEFFKIYCSNNLSKLIEQHLNNNGKSLCDMPLHLKDLMENNMTMITNKMCEINDHYFPSKLENGTSNDGENSMPRKRCIIDFFFQLTKKKLKISEDFAAYETEFKEELEHNVNQYFTAYWDVQSEQSNNRRKSIENHNSDNNVAFEPKAKQVST